MLNDMQRFISFCTACAQSKVPQALLAGKLTSLPLLQWPWSYLGMDFIPDLPESNGNTVILYTVSC